MLSVPKMCLHSIHLFKKYFSDLLATIDFSPNQNKNLFYTKQPNFLLDTRYKLRTP